MSVSPGRTFLFQNSIFGKLLIYHRLFKNIKFAFLALFVVCCACTSDNDNSQEISVIKISDLDSLQYLAPTNREQYLDSLKGILETRKNDSLTRRLYLELASAYYTANNFKKSLKTTFHVMKLSQAADDKVHLAKAYFYIGDCYENFRKDSAYFYYLKAQHLYSRNGDYENVGRMFYNKAYILFYEGNYVECESELAKSLSLLKNSSNHHLLYSCFTLMGNCLEKFNNYEDALSYHHKAIRQTAIIALDSGERDQADNYSVSSLLNICNIYDLRKEQSKSIPILRSLLIPGLKKKDPKLYANVLSNLSCSLMSIKDTVNVRSMLFESLKIVDSRGNDLDILYKKIHIGEYFMQIKDSAKALKIIQEANRQAVKVKNGNEILTTLKLLVQADKNNRLQYINQFIKISDSLNTVQKNSHTKYARIEYETSNIINQNKHLEETNFKILLFSFMMFMLLALIIIYRYVLHKSAQFKYLKKEQQANEEIYKLLTEQSEKICTARNMQKAEIARELHDGILNKIYGIRMNLGGLNAKTEQNIIDQRKKYIVELQFVENDIRDISHDLSTNHLFGKNDFELLLVSLIDSQKTITDTVFLYASDNKPDWDSMDIVFKINIYRIIQEAIFNVVKYAEASNCLIKINSNHSSLEVSVTDDGIGYNTEEAKKGIGLDNIKIRVNSMNGSFTIKSTIGYGTEMKISIKAL